MFAYAMRIKKKSHTKSEATFRKKSIHMEHSSTEKATMARDGEI
jgi:hypothetical protein